MDEQTKRFDAHPPDDPQAPMSAQPAASADAAASDPADSVDAAASDPAGSSVPAPSVPAPSVADTAGPIDPTAASSATVAGAAFGSTVAAASPSRGRWIIALGVAGIAIAVVVGALLLFSKTSAPEAFSYIPGDAALVMELRPDLPGDQLQAAGNLLAHFPGFQDQSTLTTKIDEALKRVLADAGSQVDYDKIVKPLIGGPMVLSVHTFDGMATTGDATDVVLVATINGAFDCSTASQGTATAGDAYNGVALWLSADSRSACAVDGRFLLIGDVPGVKSAIDAHKATTGLDKSTRYAAARTQLGLDRLATLYVDGTALAKALPTSAANAAVGDLAGAFPQWIIAGLRAESDALVVDVVAAPPSNPVAMPSLATYPPVRPIGFTVFAPADTLVFAEVQGAGVALHNEFTLLQNDPTFAAAVQQLAAVGGLDGLVGWVDEAGVLVFRDGDTPAGGIVLSAADASTASAKVTALETVLGLGALGGDIDVSSSTIEGIKVTTIHIPDVGAVSGVPTGTAIPLDLSIAAKDRFVIVGVGTNAMQKMLGVKAGASLAEDAAFKRALARGLANPQVVVYVAAGATIDWVESAAAAAGAPALSADVKAYLDPVEGFIYTVVGNGVNGSFRAALTVGTP